MGNIFIITLTRDGIWFYNKILHLKHKLSLSTAFSVCHLCLYSEVRIKNNSFATDEIDINCGIIVFIKGRLANTAHALRMMYLALLYCNFNRLQKQRSFNKRCTFRFSQRTVWFWKLSCAEKRNFYNRNKSDLPTSHVSLYVRTLLHCRDLSQQNICTHFFILIFIQCVLFYVYK
jgi:hypothetical protein